MTQGGFIYALGMEGSTYVKIGSTGGSVMQRLKQLQTGQPQRLYIIAALPVTQARFELERQIHGLLDVYKQGGEWFDTPMDVATLKRLMGHAMRALQAYPPTVPLASKCAPTWMPSSPSPLVFGQRVASIRQRRGLTLDALAQMAGVHFEMIERIENGLIPNPSLDIVLAIIQALEGDPNYMLGLYTPGAPPAWWINYD